MRTASHSTVEALLAAKRKFHSYDALVEHYGITKVSKGTLSRIVKGQSVSRDAENHVRAILGLKPFMVEAQPCIDCGEVHTGRCYGREVHRVECLARGYKIVAPANAPKRRAPRRTIQVTPETYGELKNMCLPKESFNDCLKRLMKEVADTQQAI